MSPEYPFDEAATARVVVDEAGTVVGWNEGARALLGWSPAEVVGRPAAELLAEGGLPAAAAPRWDGTLALRHRDGRSVRVWLLAHHRPPRDGVPATWLVVTPLPGAGVRSPDDTLATAALAQAPCAVAVYDERLRLVRLNDAMAEIVGLPEERVRGLRVSEIGGRPQSAELEGHMLRVLAGGRPEDVRIHTRTGGEERGHAWLARFAPVTDAAGRVRGVCLAAHDFTENHLARERLLLVNEASVRIGSTLDVTRTAQELAQVCVPALADLVSVELLEQREEADPPARLTAPLSLRRAAHHSVDPDGPAGVAGPGEVRDHPAGSPQADSLTTGHTVVASTLSATATATSTSAPSPTAASVSADGPGARPDRGPSRGARVGGPGVHATMSVPLKARGVTLGVAVFTRYRRQDSFTPDDVLLAEEITARAAVCIDNARRYSRERETALALQRSLLPRSLPDTLAVDAASRYLPATRTGVGGDWFDVIPLSGMRVAMVVGDVVGQGIQASATMGRLRTAVRTLADIDLAPDELLTHLDDLVVRLSEEAGGEGDPGEVGATCLYAVYDPVSRRCTFARAGHPAPVLLRPGGEPHRVELPAGPALGVGGLPFESAELELAEGSVLAFYTDGLVESRERDADTGLRLLDKALAVYADSLDETCDRVLHALLPQGGASDDVALLLARTRGLPSSQVATWDIPADPALVAPIRRQVVEQLTRWELSEHSFTAELVVSELVTNAIRYGAKPIRLRLIHDATTLICEVSDTSHTAPHLRRAKTFDEGGRGLLLVAQLTQRWGSRHNAEGKTIWAELGLLGDD
ncbi:SpoIIE family protein phosphatase [Streptomyces sp. NPDC003401]